VGLNSLALSISIVELFILGITIGYVAGDRQKPNEPKPKRWDVKLHNEWMKGFRAGEKTTLKRVAERLNHEEVNRIPWNRGEDDG
jgi:hypothetical protein